MSSFQRVFGWYSISVTHFLKYINLFHFTGNFVWLLNIKKQNPSGANQSNRKQFKAHINPLEYLLMIKTLNSNKHVKTLCLLFSSGRCRTSCKNLIMQRKKLLIKFNYAKMVSKRHNKMFTFNMIFFSCSYKKNLNSIKSKNFMTNVAMLIFQNEKFFVKF